VLDHFDSFFEQKVSQRSDVQLQGEGAAEDPPFPTDTCLAVLSATCVLLENCSNKAAYNSSEVRHTAPGCDLLPRWAVQECMISVDDTGHAFLPAKSD
jgi:hypothetical protein